MNTYVVVLRIDEEKAVGIGALGEIKFLKGYYAYAGSAKRGLSKRLERHASKSKKLHWHIDYLSKEAEFVTARLSALEECELARELESLGGNPIPGFGCSDCNCRSHLFFFEKIPGEWQTNNNN